MGNQDELQNVLQHQNWLFFSQLYKQVYETWLQKTRNKRTAMNSILLNVKHVKSIFSVVGDFVHQSYYLKVMKKAS